MKLGNNLKKYQYLYSKKELKQYEEYIMDNFGPYNQVLHEIVSPDIHLDIIIIPPTSENNYYKLITMGMGAYSMNVPKELNEYELERAELVLYLPATWNIHSNKEEDYWPIRWLKILARLPIQCNTWLGFGHTISSDEKNTPYASNTTFCAFLLLDGFNNKNKPIKLRINKLGKINFYQVFPLYKEELDFKQKKDTESFMDLLSEKDKSPIINIERKNYGKRDDYNE